ncbi:aminotransferase class I/II-fold pyridoxal phosphate-dependent enzyme [Aquimarina pacifica]|uniref:aminotransferase class I/II-fold pyridoxal phosphate-dependent enzyme n=1 Tax=Aquimarina pacifica TaxID=1296415 RepID=UPI00047027F8|nr:8-amino-7-oxononanoate synthase [Aquimarina pacifica]
MKKLPSKLQSKLALRQQANSLRTLPINKTLVDFSSNDYLGFAQSKEIFDRTHTFLQENEMNQNGATGSRLLSGNHKVYSQTEAMLATFHNAEAALIFNSGYDANVGFFSSVPQRGDLIFYDELIHASIRDGLTMSTAKSYKFDHNNLEDLEKKLTLLLSGLDTHKEVYVVTESIFSMDGDSPNLQGLVALCKAYNCHIVVDEAHAIGVFGQYGAGLLQELELEHEIFARIVTFGKALGCHGAAILGSEELKSYLVNFARSFIYTTGLSPHAVATIQSAYYELQVTENIGRLKCTIDYFKQQLETEGLESIFVQSNSAIQCCLISGNENIKRIANTIQNKGIDVKAILSPTVPEGKERLRFCLHSFNTKKEINAVLNYLTTFALV